MVAEDGDCPFMIVVRQIKGKALSMKLVFPACLEISFQPLKISDNQKTSDMFD